MKIAEIISVALASIFALILGTKWKELSLVGKVGLFLALAAAILTFFSNLFQHQKERTIEEIEAKFGDISDTKDAFFPIVMVGNSGSGFYLLSGVFSFEPYGNLFKLYIRDGRLHFWAIIRNEDGKPIAAINDNEWEIWDDGNYEYNNTKTAFEVVTKGERKVVFSLDYIGGKAVMLGMLINKNKQGLYFDQSPVPNTGALVKTISPGTNTFDIDSTNAKPIFKYPRAKYFGVRNN